MVKLVNLTNEQIVSVYNEHMIEDFPPDELKSLEQIQGALELGRYACYGLYADGELAGYVFLERLNNDYLVDYIATFPQKRNGGLGTELLAILRDALKDSDSVIGEVEDPAFAATEEEALKDSDSVIGEVEDPEFAATEEERSLQTRRLGFYLRNGILDTGVRAVCFGVHYRILTFPTKKQHSMDEIRELYKMQYGNFHSKEICDRYIQV